MRSKSDLRSAQQRTITALYEGVWQDPLTDFTGAQVVLPMGGGKTAVGLTAFTELRDDGHVDAMYVLAPKRVANLVWPAEPQLWEHLCGLKIVLVAGTPAQRLAALQKKADVYAIGLDNTQWLVEAYLAKKAPHWFKRTILAVDELSRFKNPRGKRARALAPHIGRFFAFWGLTGTPRPNGYEDQFRPLALVTQGKLWGKSFDRWREANFYPTDYMRYNWALLPEKEPQLIADINKATITIPLSEMPELPPLNDGDEFIRWVDFDDELVARYRGMERHLINKLKKRGKTVAAANMAVASGKLSQICQGFLYAGEDDDETTGKMQGYERIHDMKMETLLDILDEADGEQAVLTYEYQADLDRLMKEWPDLRYFGKSDAGDRQIEQEWNAGKLSKIAVQPASAGHGLNLQYGGTQVIGYGLTWSAELFDQLIKRFHRPGQVRPVWWRPIMARGAGITTTDQMKRLRVHDKMTLQAVFQQLLKEV